MCFFLKSPLFQIHPHSKFTPIANRPCYKSPPCGRANCNSPLHGCYQDVRKYTKKHHGHGMGSFACVVGAKSASWRSGVCDAIRPYCNSPYAVACVFSSNRPHCKSPMSQFTPIANRPCFQLPPLQIALCCCVCFFLKSPPLQIAHVTIRPHVEGLIAISPYTCVY